MGVTRTQVVKFIKQPEKGERGAALRGPQAWSDCATGYNFYSGGPGEMFIDVVMYNSNYYVCKKSHSKTGSNYPGSTTAVNNGYWQLGDKMDFVATKILMATYAIVENLGVRAIEMKDAAGNVLFKAKDGEVSCKTGTFENVTISGTLKGVTGSFRSLDCIDTNGNTVCQITFNTDGQMWFNNGDLYHQGTKSGRSLRFYTSDVWCRGQFGASERNILVVKGSYAYYYPKGISGGSVYAALTSAKDSNSNTYYKVPLYGTTGEYAGMPIDTVVFAISRSTVYNFQLVMSETQRAMVINANDDQNNVKIYSNGNLVTWNGGSMAEVVNIPSLVTPTVASNILGRGLLIGAFNDNNW